MHDAIARLRENITRVYFGNEAAVDRVLSCLLARGHLLIEDVPGVGKTVLATALARSIDCSFARVQLTPDLLPADIIGVNVLDRASGLFEFRRGPIFANVVLADEINRTPPRTQAALLEAMNEGTVTVDGHEHALERPFMLIATQNPHEYEGTYALPENQLDRFLMRIRLGYPSPAAEAQVLDQRPGDHTLGALTPVVDASELVALQEATDAVRMDPSLIEYTVRFAERTRSHDLLRVGLSTRGALALTRAARATAFVSGRAFVIPEDLIENIGAVCAHRVISAGARAASNGTLPMTPEEVLARVLESVESPA